MPASRSPSMLSPPFPAEAMTTPPAILEPGYRRLRVELTGAVQGVGFRPHVYRMALASGLTGWVENGTEGVRIEVEGRADRLHLFLHRVSTDHPPAAMVTNVRHRWSDYEMSERSDRFEIRASDGLGALDLAVTPDLATCPDCRAEVLASRGRRAGYAFTNCTACGPRFSILQDLPYDRPATTMAAFTMCSSCGAEYEDPEDRRFHAQPNACPACGPTLSWTAADGTCPEGDPLQLAVAAIRCGRIIAVKGLGGFHLMCDAGSESAVAALRDRKGRPSKPLAVMVRDLDSARQVADLSPREAEVLESAAAPIVLVRWAVSGQGVRRYGAGYSARPSGECGAGPSAGAPRPVLAPNVAPSHDRIGLFLPYTPLHHLMLAELDRPVVATSGNQSEEPICTDNTEALERLAGIADGFLLHDRPIERPVDDSVVDVRRGHAVSVRRSRGFAPFPLRLPFSVPPMLATGGHMKVAVGLAQGGSAWLGPHIGDLDTLEGRQAFDRSVRDLLRLYRLSPEIVAHDLHPDYPTSEWARSGTRSRFPKTTRRIAVQHHHAHLAALLTEHGRPTDCTPVLGVTWDGTGYGHDGTIWGGEFLLGNAHSVRRVAHLRPFVLPGGSAAIRDPQRIALALARASDLDLPPHIAGRPDLGHLDALLANEVNCPTTTSAGRLFDGIAALLGVVTRSTYEGEPAIALEMAAASTHTRGYPLDTRTTDAGTIELDWRPMVQALVSDQRRGTPTPEIAGRFHQALVAGMLAVVDLVGAAEVGLAGGCFQNRRLEAGAVTALERSGVSVLTHRIVPANDGGLALGQLAVAAAAGAG